MSASSETTSMMDGKTQEAKNSESTGASVESTESAVPAAASVVSTESAVPTGASAQSTAAAGDESGLPDIAKYIKIHQQPDQPQKSLSSLSLNLKIPVSIKSRKNL